MKQENINRYVSFILILTLFVMLYVISRYNYLLFHTTAELFSICVAFTIFVFALYSRQFLQNDYFTFLGIAYLFVSGIDLLHTLSYKGIGIFAYDNANLSTQLWIASRYLESASLLMSFIFLRKKTNPLIISFSYITIFSFLLASIFMWDIFPACFIEGEGLTTFKILSEYVISLILVLTIILVITQRDNFDKTVFLLMIIAIGFTIISELFFTFYISVYGISNLIGHMLKVLSFYCIFVAVIQVGLKKPYDLMFRDIIKKDQALNKAHDELKALLEKRTYKLHRSTEKLEEEITERHRIELFLEKSQKDYRLLAENIRDVIWTSDMSFNWSYISPSIEKVTGFSQAEALSLSLDQIMTSESIQKAYIELEKALNLLKTDNTLSPASILEAEFYHKNGSLVWVEINAEVQTDNTGKPIGIIGVIRDIVDRKKAEEEKKKLETRLYQQQRLEATGRLAGGIAHDFNNLLNIVLTNTELLKDGNKEDNEVSEFTGNISKAIYRAKNVVKQLLSFSSDDSPKVTPIDIGSVVKDTSKLLKSSTPIRIQIKINVSSDPFIIVANETQIHQIILNLVTNAADAIGNQSGMVEVSLSHVLFDANAESMPPNLSEGNYVKLTVSDTGQGIPTDNMERIFDPYFTTKPKGKGTGLGLSVVQGIVKTTGGELFVQSEPGKGTTFDLYFTAVEQHKKHAG